MTFKFHIFESCLIASFSFTFKVQIPKQEVFFDNFLHPNQIHINPNPVEITLEPCSLYLISGEQKVIDSVVLNIRRHTRQHCSLRYQCSSLMQLYWVCTRDGGKKSSCWTRTWGRGSPSASAPCPATAGARSSEALSSRESRWPSVYGTRRPTPWQKTCGWYTS